MSESRGRGMKQRAHVLVVDDQADNLLILEDVLSEHYDVHPANNGVEALGFLEAGGSADLILLDVMMPELDGFEVCRRLKASESTRSIPVMFLTSLDRPEDEELGFSLGAEDFIHKPVSPPVVLARVRTHLALSKATRALQRRNADLELMVAERTAEISEQARRLVASKQEVIAAQAATITAFCALAEARDNETGNHIRRTQHYVRILAEALRDHPRFSCDLNDDVIQQLFKSAPLHDVGKVATPDAILLKPGKLTPEEWVIMQRHCESGRDAIQQAEDALGGLIDAPFLHYAAEIAYGHHERWDGSGYPQGIAGDAIPLSARLMAVADVYDALISRRVYKPPFPHEQAIFMMLAERGRHFDPDIVDALEQVAGKFAEIATSFRDEPEEEGAARS
ncbi:HD domain-containing phosphohydrolase [uncultured Zoogloea sp.]|uniref:HD domain-containing phosphohydrolase n=1 Tax=uncultured Zoogloea sp. TaxID=160237 RepID=UPI002615D66A|nr:HD domain-containing phosphohydrolase [uncultured Zoogloea sp.]